MCGFHIKNGSPIEFLNLLRKSFPDLFIQTVNAKYVVGFSQMEMIIKQSWTAKERGRLYANKIELDIIVRLSCDKQISRALKTIGLREEVKDIALIGLGTKSLLNKMLIVIEKYGVMDDTIINTTKNKNEFLMRTNGISQEELDSIICCEDPLSYLMSEKACLISIT